MQTANFTFLYVCMLVAQCNSTHNHQLKFGCQGKTTVYTLQNELAQYPRNTFKSDFTGDFDSIVFVFN